MDAKIKARWVKALRSGKYLQGQQQLRTVNSENPKQDQFCCLGVLCDIVDKSKWGIGPLGGDSGDVAARGVYDGKTAMPPNDIRERAGLSPEQCDLLAKFNDDGKQRGTRKVRMTFKGIAAYIERSL